jgi:hypothetical protein
MIVFVRELDSGYIVLPVGRPRKEYNARFETWFTFALAGRDYEQPIRS